MECTDCRRRRLRQSRIANDAPLLQLFLRALIAGILLSDIAIGRVRGRTRTFDHAPADEPRHDPVLLKTIAEIDATAHVARAAVLAAARDVEARIVVTRVSVSPTGHRRMETSNDTHHL